VRPCDDFACGLALKDFVVRVDDFGRKQAFDGSVGSGSQQLGRALRPEEVSEREIAGAVL
jgi:hypothetical protein